jgi:ribosomal protein S18 acetylase RimI-like enzyme
MKEIIFKQTAVNDWKLVEKLEKGSASPFFLSCINEEDYKKYIRENEVFLIMINKKAVGTISYETDQDGTVIINSLTVLPEYRGKGIATNAMKKLLDGLKNKNFALLVHPENTAALLIYLRLGFVIAEWKDNYFGNGQPRLFLRKTSGNKGHE